MAPGSPSLIDFAPQRPKQTLLDDVDIDELGAAPLYIPPPPPRVHREVQIPARFRPQPPIPPIAQIPSGSQGYVCPAPPGFTLHTQASFAAQAPQVTHSNSQVQVQWPNQQRLIDAPTPAKPLAQPGTGTQNASRVIRQTAEGPATNPSSGPDKQREVERSLAAKAFIPRPQHDPAPPGPSISNPPSHWAPAPAPKYQHTWRDPLYDGPANDSYAYEPDSFQLDHRQANAVRQAILNPPSRRDLSQLQPHGTSVHPPPPPPPSAPFQQPSLPPSRSCNLRPTAQEYRPSSGQAYALWANQPPWDRSEGVSFASLPPQGSVQAAPARPTAPALEHLRAQTIAHAPLPFALDPEPEVPCPAQITTDPAATARAPVKHNIEVALAALRGAVPQVETADKGAYEQLVAALRRLNLEPPIGPPTGGKSTAPTAQPTAHLTTSDTGEGAGLSKGARKKQRARLAKAQKEEEERDLLVRTLLRPGLTAAQEAPSTYDLPSQPYNFDFPTLQPTAVESRRGDEYTFIPHEGRHITPPQLNSPPDHLPQSRGDRSDSDTAVDTLPVDVDDSEPFLSDLVGLPNTGNFSEDKALILCTEAELLPLFKSDIKSHPYPTLEQSFTQAPSAVKVPQPVTRSGLPIVSAAANSTAVASQGSKEADVSLESLPIDERIERILAGLGAKATSAPLTIDQADQHVTSVLDKYALPAAPRLQVAAKPFEPAAEDRSLVQPQPYRPSTLAPAFDHIESVTKAVDKPTYDLTRYDSNGLSRSITHESYASDQIYTPEWQVTDLPFYEYHDYSDPLGDFERYHSMSGHGMTTEAGREKSTSAGAAEGQSSRTIVPNAARARWQNNVHIASVPELTSKTRHELQDDVSSDDDDDYLESLEQHLNRGGQASSSLQPLRPMEQYNDAGKLACSYTVSGDDSAPYDLLLALPPARRRVPMSARSDKDALQSGIIHSWMAVEPPESQKLSIAALTDRLTVLINRFFSGQRNGEDRFTVDVFGSVSWDGDTGKGGDLDMVVRDRLFPQGYHPDLWSESAPSGSRRTQRPSQHLSSVHDIRQLVTILRQVGYRDVQGIPAASTPIVKFRDPSGGFECDLNVNDLGGWYNSKLILAYCEISPFVLRPLIHVLKTWAKANYVNDPSGSKGPASMSSYCLTLMAIGYLQYLGALPNLQEGVEVRVPEFPEDEAPDVIWAGYGKSQGIKCHVAFSSLPPTGWKPRDATLTAARAVRGFFDFFTPTAQRVSVDGQPSFDYTNQMVSIVNGGIIQRAKPLGGMQAEVQARRQQGLPDPTKEDMIKREARMGKGADGIQPNNWTDRRLIVQDPFIWQKNCTQAMSKAGLDRWMNAVRRSHIVLSQLGNECTYERFITSNLPEPFNTRPTAGRGRVASPQQYGQNHAAFAARPLSPGVGFGRGLGQGMGRSSPGRGTAQGPYAFGGMTVRPPVGNGGLWRG